MLVLKELFGFFRRKALNHTLSVTRDALYVQSFGRAPRQAPFTRSGKALILGSRGVVIMNEKELTQTVQLVARLEAEASEAEGAKKKKE